MQIIIHRGAHEVGGNCVEISTGSSRLLVDFGLPFSWEINQQRESCLPSSITEKVGKSDFNLDGVLLSHAHLDHYGLADFIPMNVPIYASKETETLIQITSKINPNSKIDLKLNNFKSREPFRIGEFLITPYLMDHSAFGAHAFLIEGDSKSIFYTGDFRGHGRKAKLFELLLDNPPKVDVLLVEGTMLGSRQAELTLRESELETKLVKIIERTKGIVFVTTSSQNIDRLVTIFRAAKRTGRRLIMDFYTAEILRRLQPFSKNLPKASWPRILVCFPRFLFRRFSEMGEQKIMERHAENAMSWDKLAKIADKSVMLMRPPFKEDVMRGNFDLTGATWVYSMWKGYLEKSDSMKGLKSWMCEHGVNFEFVHTSGHIKLEDLIRFSKELKPKMLIPIHSSYPEQFKEHMANVRLAQDGEVITI